MTTHFPRYVYTYPMHRLILPLALTLTACSPRLRIVQVPEVHTEIRERLRIDSVYLHDSIYLHEYTRGDTIYLTKEHHHWHYRTKTDTLRLYRTDSVPVVKEVAVEKPRAWVKDFREVALWVIVALVVLAVGRWRR